MEMKILIIEDENSIAEIIKSKRNKIIQNENL